MVQYVESSRLRVSDSTEVVLSMVVPEDDGKVTGVNINTYVTSAKYTGFTRGVFVPTESVDKFKGLVANL